MDNLNNSASMNLIQFFGDEAPSRTSVYRLYGEFIWGRSSLRDKFREGLPKSVVVPETIEAVCQLIFHDYYVSYREIETSLVISGTPVYIQYCMNIWLSKKFIRFGSHTICQSLKKKKSINQSIREQLVQTHAKV